MIIFFFKEEDGIRDRSPARGLGDVDKRQFHNFPSVVTLRIVFSAGFCRYYNMREQKNKYAHFCSCNNEVSTIRILLW